MAERRRFEGASLRDVTPSVLGIARGYPEVIGGRICEWSGDPSDAPAAARHHLPFFDQRTSRRPSP